jgi:hypothetical protein
MLPGISDGDARHLMYAVHNKCDRFVTLDTGDLLPKRSAVASFARARLPVRRDYPPCATRASWTEGQFFEERS